MTILGVLVLTVAVVVFFLMLRTGRRAGSLPPGPPTIPLFGNLLQIPKASPHYRFTEWANKYGGIYSLKLGPGIAIVLTDPRLIKQLIDKKGSIYSDRPKSYVGNELITGGNHVLLMHYSDRWRRFRKLMQHQFNEGRVERDHVQLIEAEAVQMMHDFMMDPQEMNWHPKRFSNSVAMSLIYGIRTRNTRTKHMRDLYRIMEDWSRVMETGATPPVDLIPWLKYLPQSLWGNWKNRAKDVGRGMDELYKELADRVRQRRANGTRAGCLMDHVLDQQPNTDFGQAEFAFFGGTILEGGSDTSSSMILAFIQAMIKYPHIQKKAQLEIDCVTNSERSPVWGDYSDLPYVVQVVKETMRWRPVTPLSVPHATIADDEIDGFKIPKGSTVIINVWGLHNSPRHSKQSPPSQFDPDRYDGRTKLASEFAASADYAARDHYGYGAGRRLCPGIHVAERNLFIGIAKLLWAFEFREKSGHVIDVDPRTGYSEGFLHCAKPFQCDVKVRDGRGEVILKEFERAGNVMARYEE
ncbi:putative cytochrome P450 [Dendryphion nanum]|uniref:Cytochrome P450 n=1 Tax=Dendryphion nanum TaxID=256645 RepID=A0A9P9E586_9PLEO|nr:putative cytochrome P450 [Dendryphion nanum]